MRINSISSRHIEEKYRQDEIRCLARVFNFSLFTPPCEHNYD
jgi:hypothetical protein